MTEFDIKYYSSQEPGKEHDFARIAEMISSEPSLLHPDQASLQESFAKNQAVVMYDDEKLIGFVRFTPLLTPQLKEQIGLPENFPDISEIGSAVLLNSPEYRGKGLYAPLRNRLLETIKDRVEEEKLLVLGTTKNIAVYKVLPQSSELGIDFYTSRHTEFPMIAPFTCVCSPDFGCGFQLSTECPERVEEDQLINLINISESNKGKIPCIMYVSDKSLAERMDKSLGYYFGGYDLPPQQTLVQRLVQNAYYE